MHHEQEFWTSNPQPEAYTHHDAVTCTRSTVKFNKETNTGVVTLVATVRGDPLVQDEHTNERAIIQAAHALAHVCATLEEKANNTISGCEKPTTHVIPHVNHVALTEEEIQHNCIVDQLRNGEFTEVFEIKKGYGATPFRPVFVVKLSHPDGTISHGLFKPFIHGDVHRYTHASPEWVAYQVCYFLHNKFF